MLEQALRREDPLVAAVELRGLASVEALADVAADRDRSARQRVVALLAIALALAEDPTARAPDGALEAIDEPEVVETALAAGLGGALTGVLAAAPVTPGLRATRLLIGRRMAAAGELGVHVAELLLCGGDRDRAADIARTAIAEAGSDVATWATLRWLCAKDDALVEAILSKLPDNLLKELGAQLTSMPGAEPPGGSRVRAAIGWIVDSRKDNGSRS